VGAGLGYALTPQFTLSADYRYFATADPKFTDVDGINFDYEYASHNASVNVRYQF
jgi:opacity protein-like surface antigen